MKPGVGVDVPIARSGGTGRTVSAVAAAVATLTALALGAGFMSAAALAGNLPAPDTVLTPSLAPLLNGSHPAIETVTFGASGPLRIVRGLSEKAAPPASAHRGGNTEIVSFGPGGADRVRVVRGPSIAPTPGAAGGKPEGHTETVSFADPAEAPVTVVRGPSLGLDASSIDLFAPASAGELDRVAFAVDGVESRHGADPRMWRPSLTGPQGPMQVSAAAAFDVGGGDRFDPQQNRLMGRAYLAQMYERYGNWRDAVAAYNWGPGNMDAWIAGGRDGDRLPAGVAWYIAKVLHDAVLTTAAARGW